MMYNGVQCEFPPGYDGTVLLERLQPILDPELDESILQLGFIQSLHVHNGHATIVVQLPTSWCAANFAYMMADDIRRALLTVEGIHHVTVRLRDHFAAEAIETAVNAGKPFAEAFPGEGCGSLTALRMTFLHKGFTSRQERLLRALKAVGFSPEDICALRVGDVVVQGDACVVQRAGHPPIEVGAAETLCRYLARRAELGLDCAATVSLMTDLHGQPLTVERLDAYYQAARTVRVSLEANGLFCRTLLTVCQPNAGKCVR
jgi:metal-sulfur cluster biosynthetic enzyme